MDEGSTYELTLGTVSDPGNDSVSEYVVHWGDGSSDTYYANGVVTHVYADGPATPTITVDLVDEDGTHTDTGSLSLTVDNVAPTIALSGAAGVDEGSTYELTLGTINDPGDDTVTEYTVHWGDGFSDVYSAAVVATTSGVVTHVYDNGPSTPEITVDLVDEDGIFLAAGSLDVVVNNVNPTATFIAPTPVNEGTLLVLALTAPFDPSVADTNAGFDYAFDCGSGSLIPAATPTASCSTYGTAGWRTVRGEIRDQDDGFTIYPADVYVTPSREVIEDLREDLALLLPTGDKNDDKDIEKAIKAIDKSLNSDFWDTGSRLTKKGNKVFDEMKSAVKDLEKVDSGPASAVIAGLVEVSRVLAFVQIADAEAANGNPKDLAKAAERMVEAQEEIDAGNYDKAIDDYKKAWEYARKAAGKPIEAASIDMSDVIEMLYQLFLPISTK